MNFLVDANLSPRVAAQLTSVGHMSRHVGDCALAEARDAEILVYAVEHGLVVLTADTDFGTLLAATSASSPSVVRLRSQDHLTPDQQVDQLLANLATVEGDLAAGAVVTLGRGRLRVRALPIGDADS